MADQTLVVISVLRGPHRADPTLLERRIAPNLLPGTSHLGQNLPGHYPPGDRLSPRLLTGSLALPRSAVVNLPCC